MEILQEHIASNSEGCSLSKLEKIMSDVAYLCGFVFIDMDKWMKMEA